MSQNMEEPPSSGGSSLTGTETFKLKASIF